VSTDRFLSLFFEEARELLQALESGLMDLEARREDRAHLDRTFRAAHTLKGAAGMVGLAAIAQFTHGVEAVLDAFRSSRLAVGRDAITVLLAAHDHLAAALAAAAEGQAVADDPALVARLARLLNQPSDEAGDSVASAPAPDRPTPGSPSAPGASGSLPPGGGELGRGETADRPRPTQSVADARDSESLPPGGGGLGRGGERADHRRPTPPAHERGSEPAGEDQRGSGLVDRPPLPSSPPPGGKEPEPFEGNAPPGQSTEPTPKSKRTYRIRFQPTLDLLRTGVNPLGILDELRELGEAHVEADWRRVPPLEELDPDNCDIGWTITLRTDAEPEQLDEVFLFLDDRRQVTIEPIEAEAEAPPSQAPAPEPKPVPAEASAPAKVARPAAGRIRVDAGLLDELVGTAGEMGVLIESLQGLSTVEGARPWAGMLEALERVGRRLRDSTLELRMVAIEELFVRFPRVVRDLAERSGKQINLRTEGEDTRLDRTIIERLVDPMIHLIRNAIDHGLEPPEERRAAGKPAAGRLTIAAGHEGDRVAIRVSDDGRGLDRATIARKAIARGLLPPDTPPEDPRVGNVIFEPGFSTRDQVGELSGRGVGLDVVRDAIRALRGTVSLRSVEGRGTTFVIRLPLTLAMIDGLLVESDGGRYVVPMGQVEECVALDDGASISTMGRRAAVVRGEFVPLVSLRAALGGKGSAPGRQELLLTRHAEQRVGVAVDRLLGRVQAVIQPLDEGLAALRRFSGATILADGAICLILDLMTVVAEARAKRRG
jgi:two-component system chemotaxis sensor kinase CheA